MARTSKTRSARAAAPVKSAKKRSSLSTRTKKSPDKATSRQQQPRRSRAMLSRTTPNAKWIENAVDHADRPGQSLATRNHEVIQKWAQGRGAVPATVTSRREPRVLRFDFSGSPGGKRLQQISWEEWFKAFDERELVFVYQEHLKNGNRSNFFRLDNPEQEAA